MNLKRRHAIAATLAFAASSSYAQGGSSKALKIVVSYAPGGLIDVMNRIIVPRLSTELQQPVIIENRAGANANLGPVAVLQAPADGLTLLASASYLTINPAVEKDLQWRPDQLVPVARFALSPSLLVVPSSSSAQTLRDLITMALAKPDLNIPESGLGASQTMVKEMLQHQAKVKFTAVGYKGGSAYLPDLLNGTHVMAVTPFNVVFPLVKSGQLRALAITSSSRSPLLPDVPTMAESGYRDAAIDSWLGLHVRVGTPSQVIDRLSAAVRAAASDDEVRTKLQNLGATSAYLDTPAFTEFLKQDNARAELFVKLLKANGRTQ
ncbi:tripartite tricarboxylate transporter substrate binding protein [Pseudorhodoferax sp. LjRoot39]|uniref:tripartite tricarboxylate transporter substrate binding protein n=1 Tax=Pseudorhodoferax sp. LjRoot39 TaxID=3342328 RepID=UPI003ECEB2D3